ncbi:hypothetical protein AB837_00358 [bacterium AB1]|nr:hypothetical protein AB837_00358 [bacterium AB1]
MNIQYLFSEKKELYKLFGQIIIKISKKDTKNNYHVCTQDVAKIMLKRKFFNKKKNITPNNVVLLSNLLSSILKNELNFQSKDKYNTKYLINCDIVKSFLSNSF